MLIIYFLPQRGFCKAVLYSITLYLDYSKSLLRYPIDRKLSSLPAALPMGNSTRSDRCGSTLFASPRGRQDISDSNLFTSLPSVFELVHGNEIVGPLVQCEKPDSHNHVSLLVDLTSTIA